VLSRADFFGLYAARQAVDAAALGAHLAALREDAAQAFRDRTGVCVGAGGGAYRDQYDFLPLLAEAHGDLGTFGRKLAQAVHPMWLLRVLPNNVLCHVGITHGFKGPNACITNHSVSGAQAVIEAAATLRGGATDRIVAVGYDAPVEPQRLHYYDGVGVLTDEVVRPFDADRSGCALGEGAAALVLETDTSARARGAPVLGEYLGGGCATEGEGLLSVRADGDGLARAIDNALADAALRPEDVGMIVAHGNATRDGDASEAAALRRVFADDVPPVTATKWVFGHLLAASATLDVVLALAALRAGEVPGVAPLRRLARDCAPLPVSATAQRPRSDVALVLCRGFGGVNAAIVVRGVKP
jgi:3-oxoacyl-[acyl-carrier-protein] synthase-1